MVHLPALSPLWPSGQQASSLCCQYRRRAKGEARKTDGCFVEAWFHQHLTTV